MSALTPLLLPLPPPLGWVRCIGGACWMGRRRTAGGSSILDDLGGWVEGVVATGTCGFGRVGWGKPGGCAAGEAAAVDLEKKLCSLLLVPNLVSRSGILLGGVARAGAAHGRAVDIARSPS